MSWKDLFLVGKKFEVSKYDVNWKDFAGNIQMESEISNKERFFQHRMDLSNLKFSNYLDAHIFRSWNSFSNIELMDIYSVIPIISDRSEI